MSDPTRLSTPEWEDPFHWWSQRRAIWWHTRHIIREERSDAEGYEIIDLGDIISDTECFGPLHVPKRTLKVFFLQLSGESMQLINMTREE